MKITDVRVEHYRWPKAKPIANGKHTYTHNELNLLVVDTDEGITGYGCSWAIEFAETMGPAIIGMDPLDTERIFQKMRRVFQFAFVRHALAVQRVAGFADQRQIVRRDPQRKFFRRPAYRNFRHAEAPRQLRGIGEAPPQDVPPLFHRRIQKKRGDVGVRRPARRGVSGNHWLVVFM